MAYGIYGMTVQFTLFPTCARRFGVLNCLKACAIAFPVANFLIPFTALLPTETTQIAGCFAILLLKCSASIFAFPSSTILLTNSATSLRTLGTLNGFATSFSSIGRALGPFLGGWLFSVGVEAGYVVAPWWMFCAVGIVSAIPVWFLVEGEGFGGDDDHVSDDEDLEEEEERLLAEGLEGEAEAVGRPGPELVPTGEQVEEQEEEAYGGFAPMTRTTTMSSAFSLGSDEYSINDLVRQASNLDEGPSSSGHRSRSNSRPSLGRRGSRRVMRRTSIPFGMGQAISRRYSSNLGQSFGSAGGFNAPE